MEMFEDIRRVCEAPGARGDISPIVQKLGLRIGLTFFEGIKGKVSKVRRLAGGVLTFGDRLVPFHGHQHPDDHEPTAHDGDFIRPTEKNMGRAGKSRSSKENGQPSKVPELADFYPKNSRESISSTKVSRRDCRTIELNGDGWDKILEPFLGVSEPHIA